MLFRLPVLPSLPISCSCSGAEQKDGGWGLPYDFSLSSWNGAKLPQLWKSDKRKKIKGALILVNWNSRIIKIGVWALMFFFQRGKRGDGKKNP